MQLITDSKCTFCDAVVDGKKCNCAKAIKAQFHEMGLHRYAEKAFLVVDSNPFGFSTISFENPKDAAKVLEIRKNQGHDTFEIQEVYYFKHAFVDGPEIPEYQKDCPLCLEILENKIYKAVKDDKSHTEKLSENA